jgi:hypothetical protein
VFTLMSRATVSLVYSRDLEDSSLSVFHGSYYICQRVGAAMLTTRHGAIGLVGLCGHTEMLVSRLA